MYYNVLKLQDGEPVVAAPDTPVGLFRNVEPYLYWSCQRDPADPRACGEEPPAKGFQWSFSFGNGFQGTTTIANKLYVMVYHPGRPGAP